MLYFVERGHIDLNLQVIIPVYHPDKKFKALLASIKKQTISQLSVLIIDSDYNGCYDSDLVGLNVNVVKIKAQKFNHGGTRQMGINICPNADIYIFLTQDAILDNELAIKKIVEAFKDCKVGCAYGRQIPHANASVLSARARAFNYPSQSKVLSNVDVSNYGIKTAFISNSFAAYRSTAIKAVGGFPSGVILSEDMYVAAKMIIAGWKKMYCAESIVRHSHDYTIYEEFRRYFDIGVFHSREEWILEYFGKAEKEGRKFIVSEFAFLLKNNPCLIVEMLVRGAFKYFGYLLGKNEAYEPKWLKCKFSMNKKFWQEKM